VTVTFKNPSTAPSGTYRVLISTGGTVNPWGGYQDQNLDFSDKKSSVVFTIPGSNFNNASTYKVYLENPGVTYNATMCEFPGVISILNKNFADFKNVCKINMPNNYKEGDQLSGSVFLPNDSSVKFYFQVYKGKILNTLPKTPVTGTGTTNLPIINLGTSNAVAGTQPANRVLVAGENTLQINSSSSRLNLGEYTAVIHATTGGGTSSDPAFHFYCAGKEFQISRDETTGATPGTTQTAPGANVDEAKNFKEEITSCVEGSANCTTSKPQACPDGLEGVMTAIGCIPTEPKTLVEGILKFISVASGGIALLLMILAALSMITAEGNPDTIKKAQEKFYSAIIGLLLVIFSVLLMQVIGVDILGIQELTNPLPRGEAN
jgi:hypothetical protein